MTVAEFIRFFAVSSLSFSVSVSLPPPSILSCLLVLSSAQFDNAAMTNVVHIYPPDAIFTLIMCMWQHHGLNRIPTTIKIEITKITSFLFLYKMNGRSIGSLLIVASKRQANVSSSCRFTKYYYLGCLKRRKLLCFWFFSSSYIH